MATLLTHTGLVLFLVAAAVTSRLGDEQGLVVAEGDSLTVQPIGTPGLLLVRNLGFDAPGFDTGRPTDFTTHLAVYQDGKQVADKTIRVNDPLTVGGYTFHQNGFGPAPDVVIRDQAGKPLWTGPIAMTDSAAGFPLAEFAVPGRDVALQLLLQRASDGTGILLVLPFRSLGTNADGTPNVVGLGPVALARGESATPDGTDFSVELRGFGDYTLLIAKKDPGQGIVWVAFAQPDHRDRDLVLAAATPGLGPPRPRRPPVARDAGRSLRGRRARVRSPARRPRGGAAGRPTRRNARVPGHRLTLAADLAAGPRGRRETVAAPSRTWSATSPVESAGYTPGYRPDPGRLPVPSTAPAVRRRPRRDSVPASIPRR